VKYLLNGQETERLRFRNFIESDFNPWLEFFRDRQTHAHWTQPTNSPEVECRKWFEKQSWRYENDLGGMNALIEKQSSLLVGFCGLLVQTVDEQQELEIGYSLLPQFWRLGYASEAARKCRDYAFQTNFSESLISIISTTNVPSQKVAMTNGMKNMKQTTYHDNRVYIFRINKREWESLRN
jgi:[ribosomal protein S5]-alanine N-acetyltransferase